MTAKPLPPILRLVSPSELAERIAAERRGSPFLLYLDDARRQRIVDLGPDTESISIGREPANEVHLDWDSEVSRTHAILERVGDAWTLVDDGLSRNGSFVNSRRVRGRRRLDDGDSIAIGKTLLVYVATEGAVRTTSTTKSGTPPQLTAAQQRVLDALCRPTLDGPLPVPAANREIAAELFLSVETIKSHMQRAVRAVRHPRHATEPQARRAREASLRARGDQRRDTRQPPHRRVGRLRARARGQRSTPSEPNGLRGRTRGCRGTRRRPRRHRRRSARAGRATSQRAWSRGPPVNAGSHWC